MKNSLENPTGEKTRNLLIALSLFFSILFFLAFSSLLTTGDKGVVTTSIISVRIGDIGMETGNIDSNKAHDINKSEMKRRSG